MSTLEMSELPELPKITLGIPTYRRFDPFLKVYLPKYLSMPFVDEILICDETGEDINKIKQESWGNDPKLKLVLNPKRLGIYLNKRQVLHNSTNDWVAIIDSDNEVLPEYFTSLIEYWRMNGVDKNTIYMPGNMQTKDFYNNVFDTRDGNPRFLKISGMKVTKDSWNTFIKTHGSSAEMSLNCMNWVCHKSNLVYLPENISNIVPEFNSIKNPELFAADSIFITKSLVKNGLTFLIVPNMKYYHIVHDGSVYMQTCHDQLQMEILKNITYMD